MRLQLGAPMITLLLLSACAVGGGGSEVEQLAQDIRGNYLSMSACHSTIEVTADYGQRIYSYTMEMTWESEGDTVLTITQPESIAGVTVRVADGETVLIYDDVQVETGPLYEGGMSPVDVVPTLLQSAKEGFIAECGMEILGETEALRICCRDPEGQSSQGEETILWFEPTTGNLLQGELAVDGVTVIQCIFQTFTQELPTA